MKLLFFLLAFIQASSVARNYHQPAIDYISNNYPNVVRKCPELLGAVDKLYVMVNETFTKAILDPEKADVYQRVDAEVLWALLCQENPRLDQHLDKVEKLVAKVSEDVESSKTLKMILCIEYNVSQYSFFGCYLRSLILKTTKAINSGKSTSLSALNWAREAELRVKFFNELPNSFYNEHLLELIWVYQALDNVEGMVAECVVRTKRELCVDVQSMYFLYLPDISLESNGYYFSSKPPRFIQEYLRLERDYITIDGERCLSMFGLGALVNRYWNALTTFKIQEKYYDTTLPFAQNVDRFRSRVINLNKLWLLSGKHLGQGMMMELRNLSCTYDFLYYYGQLIEFKYDLVPLEKALLKIVESNNI